MNDRFKFRVWDKEEEEYTDLDWAGYEIFLDCDGDLTTDAGTEDMRVLCDEQRYITEQCTGLKDKNGKLIYEGDIVDYNNDIAEVFFCEAISCFSFTLQRKKYTDYAGDICRLDIYTVNCEVIGNIHENADLLKVG